MTEIFLTLVQTGLILLGCLYIVWSGRPDWAAGIYLGLASWATVIRFQQVNHIWVFLITMIGAGGVYWLRHRGGSLIPRRDAWIVPWMAVWWGWMLLIIGLNDVDQVIKDQILLSLLFYTVAPLPIFLLFATDVQRVRGFALSYLLTTIVGGLVALSRLSALGISLGYLFSDPVLSQHGIGDTGWFIHTMGIVNYHWFAYAFGVSFILLMALLQQKRRGYGYLIITIGAVYCVYFLLISNSRQSVGSTVIVGLLFAFWAVREAKAMSRRYIILFVGLVLATVVFLLLSRPELLLRSVGSVPEAFNIVEDRGIYWAYGWDAFVRSPIWGDGFAGSSSLGHNFFISTLANQGLVGMVFLIGFLVFLVKQVPGVWARKGTPEQAVWRMAFLCVALFSLFVAQVSGSPVSTWPLFWSAAILWRLKQTVEKRGSLERVAVSVGQAPQSVSQSA